MRSVIAFVIIAGASTVQADPIEGRWRTALDDNGYSGIIEVKPCGEKLCGQLIQSFNDKGEVFVSEFDGRNILSETIRVREGTYRGRAFSPDRRKTYNSRLTLSGNRLTVKGCILGVCRDGGTWTRLE